MLLYTLIHKVYANMGSFGFFVVFASSQQALRNAYDCEWVEVRMWRKEGHGYSTMPETKCFRVEFMF